MENKSRAALRLRRAALAASSFLCVYSLPRLFPLGDKSIILNNSVMSIILCAALYLLLRICFRESNRRSLICSLISGFFFSVMLAVGSQMGVFDYIPLSSPQFYAAVAGGTILFSAVVNFILVRFDGRLSDAAPSKLDFLFCPGAAQFFLTWLIIFLCYVPCFLAVFPGIYAYDAISQLIQASEGNVTSIHPVLHTYFTYFTFSAGMKLFGSSEAGMAVYSVTQMLLFSASLAFVCRRLAARGMPRALQVFALLFFALNPMFAVMAVSSTKDVLFASAVLLFVSSVWDIIAEPDRFFSSPLMQLRFVLFSFFLYAAKNNGILILLSCAPFLILALKNYRIRTLLLCAVCIVSFLLYNAALTKIFNVGSGNIREALSVPIQQIARVAVEDRDELSDGDMAEILRFMPDALLYQPHIADNVKGSFDTVLMLNNKAEFINLYFRLGAEHPLTYLKAFLSCSLGFWYPDADYQSEDAIYKFWYMEFENKPQLFGENAVYVTRSSLLPRLEKIYENVAMHQTINKIPILSMAVSCGFPFWTILLCAVYLIYKKRYSNLAALVPLFAFWVILIFSPAVIFRYALPLILSLPLIAALMFDMSKSSVPGPLQVGSESEPQASIL